MEWIRFEDKKPELFQEIFIVWPSGTIPPEYRRWSEEMNQHDWSMMRWLPCPPYPNIQDEVYPYFGDQGPTMGKSF